MSESSKDTSENSQEGSPSSSLSSGEKLLVIAGVQEDVPSPPRPAQSVPAASTEEAGIDPEPERFVEGKIYTPEQIAEARHRVLDHLERSVKDLTDWQFAEQCDIAGLDQLGEPKRMSDEEVHSAQRAMDQETVLARTTRTFLPRCGLVEYENPPPQKRSGLATRKGTAHCTSKPARSMS